MAVVIYFSHGGETLINGEIKKLDIGNTAKLAQLIGKQLGMPTFPILAAIPYPDSYDQTLQRSKLDAEKLVAIQPIAVDLRAERDIYIGFPVWWGTLPGAVDSRRRFLAKSSTHFVHMRGADLAIASKSFMSSSPMQRLRKNYRCAGHE
ncbi:hypothetical protein C5L31_002088 [Secundilactobacillus malefermentans]|uniref:Flavodoxin-like domain-containing protein n=1 Tax=Secundilactobacillus malefermentans TaxID=176292 RepID=A0A4R5NHG8_9LACO|nr:hypothetical protein [Secundilactobacillus malefermentans]KRM59126.1 hypothetical protein FD44_GL000135 [Secundilactobacillus malefermentans DSM 5705 = KCTC 3548]TDG73937.1 hypothetical protein C5L31_002088 [Secundilactobacillus malefermentans]